MKREYRLLKKHRRQDSDDESYRKFGCIAIPLSREVFFGSILLVCCCMLTHEKDRTEASADAGCPGSYHKTLISPGPVASDLYISNKETDKQHGVREYIS